MATIQNITGELLENSVKLDERKAQVTDKLQKRDTERLDDVRKRRDEKESASVKSESTQFFLDNFAKSRSEIEEKLGSSGEVVKRELPSHFDNLLVMVQKLQKYLTDSTMFISSFDLQKSQEVINKLQADIQSKRDELIPKKKFAFKGKKKTDVNITAKVPEPVKKEIKVEISECHFKDVTDQTLIKNADELEHKDVALTRLSNCVIKLYGYPGAVHINNLKNCKVFSGPVSGSIFIDECTNCTFVMPCQQMRIHSTNGCDFYIHVTSKAIIEDCQKVRFAPYNWKYPAIEQHYKVSGLDTSRNNWYDVDDFNWLASDTPSPNWSKLPDGEQIMEWDE